MLAYCLQSRLCGSLPTEWMSSSELAQILVFRELRETNWDWRWQDYFRLADNPDI
jgi:hypothetical protein